MSPAACAAPEADSSHHAPARRLPVLVRARCNTRQWLVSRSGGQRPPLGRSAGVSSEHRLGRRMIDPRGRQPALPFETPPIAGPPTSVRAGDPTHPDPTPIVFVRHPRARRYLIRVADDGTVRVTVPRWGSKREAAAFVERETRWIEAQRRRVEEERARRALYPAPSVDARVERGLRERAKRELPPRLLDLAVEHGLTVARVSVRNQRWRWGSCSRAGHICLNWRLVAMPPAVRDYVMIHE